MSDSYIRDCVHQFSRLVDNSLDCLGYKKEHVVERADNWAKISNEKLERMQGLKLIVAGSRQEGVPLEGSDYDLQEEYVNVLCMDNSHSFPTDISITVLEAMMRDCPAGYTRLLVRRFGQTYPEVIEASIVLSGNGNSQQLLSSKLFNSYHITTSWTRDNHLDLNTGLPLDRTCNGPALSYRFVFSYPPIVGCVQYLDMDSVPTLPMRMDTVLENWSKKQRCHDWPPPEVISDVKHAKGILVATSLRESRDCELEWRLCFPQGEKRLVLSFNEWQIKVYVLLKMVNKEIISKTSSGLTSYMMKNTVFWVCEEMPSALFTPHWLIDRLKNCLYFIRYCVTNNFLPCYLIPERNLLLGKLEGHNKYRVLNIISKLEDSNGGFLYECASLSEGIFLSHGHPDVARDTALYRSHLESCFLSMWDIFSAYTDTSDSNESLLLKVAADPRYLNLILKLMNYGKNTNIITDLLFETFIKGNYSDSILRKRLLL